MLRFSGWLAVSLIAAGVSLTSVARAADPGDGTIHGADAMDGKDKPGQDGWSWAPVPKTQSASQSGKAPGEGKADESANGSRAVPDTGKHLSAGQDPGTPMPTSSADPNGAAITHAAGSGNR